MSSGRPAMVMLGKSRVLEAGGLSLTRKLRVLNRHFELTWISVGQLGWRRREGAQLITIPSPGRLGRLGFYCLSAVVAVGVALRERAGVVCQSPFEAAWVMALCAVLPARVRPRVIVEVHGDWRAMSRLYGSRLRRMIAPLADRVAVAALRRADRVRVISGHVERQVRSTGYTRETDRFMAWTDFATFLEPQPCPLPDDPHVVFVGALEGPKAIDVLLDAWPDVIGEVPTARLTVLGRGSLDFELRRQAHRLGIEESVRFEGSRDPYGVRRLLDGATCLVLPSRSEGLGRVLFEAMARGRAVIASAVHGVPELVQDGETGTLVPPDDPGALSRAVVRMLSDMGEARRMGDRARERAVRLDPLAEYDAGMERLSTWLTEQLN